MSRRIINNAIQKFYSIPDLDSRGERTVNLLKVGQEGPDKSQLGNLELSREELEKAGVKFKPDHAYLHVITLGAGEFFGCNLKGDMYHESPRTVTFPEAPGVQKDLGPGLKDNHCTFMQAEGVYRHHNYSKPPEGNIVFERYNSPMHRGEVIIELPLSLWEKDLQNQCQGNPLRFSQGCFTAGNLVKTSMGYTAIEDVTKDDFVVTHTGKLVEVENTRILHLQDAPMNTIKTAGGVETTSTDYHMYFIIKREILQPKLRYVEDCDIQENGEWIQAKDIQEGDFVVMPFGFDTEVIDDVSPELARLAGYYLAKVKYNKSYIGSETVYDIQISDEDHSYTVNNMAVHNSSVSKDLCSICSFEYSAKEPKRCDHIRNHKLEIYPDGTQAYVYNPNPKFYEISEVSDRPADKISMALKKVAQDGDPTKPKQDLGLSLPRSNQRTLYIVSSTPDKRKVLGKLRDHHHRMSVMPNEHDVQAVKSCSMKPEEQDEVVSKLSPLEWNELLPGLRSKKCMLTPQVWRSILFNTKSGNQIPDVCEFEDALNNVIENMDQDIQEDILDDTDYSSLPFSVTEAAKSSIQPIQSYLSLDPIKAALRPSDDKNVSLIIVKKGTEPSPAAEFLAREYVKYQTEVLTEIGSGDEGAIYLAAANTKTRS